MQFRPNDFQNESQYDSLIDSYLDFDTNKENKKTIDNEDEDDSFLNDNKIKQKLKQMKQSSNFFFNNDEDEEEELSEAELEYRRWIKQNSENKQDQDQNVNQTSTLIQVNNYEDSNDEESNQMQNKYNSIISAFDSESSSELPPEYSAALLSFSKEMNSFSKDEENLNNSNSDHLPQSPMSELSEKLQQQLTMKQDKQKSDIQNCEFDSQSDTKLGTNK